MDGKNIEGELETRLGRPELLLFRSPLTDFKLLDEHIASVLRKTTPRHHTSEPERIPTRVKGLTRVKRPTRVQHMSYDFNETIKQ